MSDPFLAPSSSPANIDRFMHRSMILSFLKECAPYLAGCCLDVGCGNQPYKNLLLQPPFDVNQYLGLDIAGARLKMPAPDIFWTDAGLIPLPDCSIDCAISTEVLEHCPDPSTLLSEVYRVLRPGGNLLLTTPFLWPLHEVPYDWCRYTPFALNQILKEARFEVCDLRSFGGYDRCLAQMLGLWLLRRPMNRFSRKVLLLSLYPIWKLLQLTREHDSSAFGEGQMITGLMARAVKR